MNYQQFLNLLWQWLFRCKCVINSAQWLICKKMYVYEHTFLHLHAPYLYCILSHMCECEILWYIYAWYVSAIQCDPLPTPAHGDWVYSEQVSSKIPYGGTAVIKCYSGYQLAEGQSSNTRTCQSGIGAEGRWDGSTSRCESKLYVDLCWMLILCPFTQGLSILQVMSRCYWGRDSTVWKQTLTKTTREILHACKTLDYKAGLNNHMAALAFI